MVCLVRHIPPNCSLFVRSMHFYKSVLDKLRKEILSFRRLWILVRHFLPIFYVFVRSDFEAFLKSVLDKLNKGTSSFRLRMESMGHIRSREYLNYLSVDISFQ